ncbi:MAG: flavin reductase family protein [Pseudomonadota bacterium]
MTEDIDQKEFRTALGNFATGVVIVTTMSDGLPEGMTIGAFTSVSLAPPLVAFLPAQSSVTWPKIRAAGKFAINILSNDQEGTCMAFARTSGTKFDGVNWDMSHNGTPHLAGALAWLDCTLDQVFSAGDHDIALGRVVSLTHGDAGAPLVFYRGKFHNIHAQDVAQHI